MTEAESLLLAVMRPKPKPSLADDTILRLWNRGFNTLAIARTVKRPESEIVRRLALLRTSRGAA